MSETRSEDEDYRCSAASEQDAEPLAGTAPTDTDWLFVQYAGPWGRKAVRESRLPEPVRAHLSALSDRRVQLIRRHGGEDGPGVRVFTAHCGPVGAEVRTALLDDVAELPELDLARDTTAYDDPLWLVCTNGRRDVCCAELGRPIAAALTARWPAQTWETTHLGGHRFAGTLLALPSGLTLGRLDPATAVEACVAVEAGRVPLAHTRGRAGLSGGAQTAELHVRATHSGATEVRALADRGDEVDVAMGSGSLGESDAQIVTVRVETVRGTPRRQSCADLEAKPATIHRVVSGT